VIIFGLVRFLSKNITKPKIVFWKKTRNRVKPTGFGSVWFFREKTSSNRFGLVFPVLAWFSRFWLGFCRFGSVFFRFFFVSVRFGTVRFFWFFAYKTETEPAGFFKILIGLIDFFFQFSFFSFFFSDFLNLINFSVFFLTPTINMLREELGSRVRKW